MIQRTVEYSQPSISMGSTSMDSIIWDQKYSGKRFQKIPKSKTWICCEPGTVYIALTLHWVVKVIHVCVCVCACAVFRVVSNSSRPHGLKLTSLLCPWDFPGKNTGAGCHLLLQGICPTQGSDLHLLCPVSPALAGGFFTTVAPGKPIISNLEILKSIWEVALKLYAKSSRFYIRNLSIGGFWYPEGRSVLESRDNTIE